MTMTLFYYSSERDQNAKRLEVAIHSVIPEGKIEPFEKLEDLRERLRRPVESDSIAVLSALNHEELRQLQPLRKLLPEIYVVLVIPDRKESTVDLAHLMLPRFLSQHHDDFADLSKVLKKMHQKSLPPESFIGKYLQESSND